MLDGLLALPEGRQETRWPWAQSQSQWPIGLQPQPQGGHSCWLPREVILWLCPGWVTSQPASQSQMSSLQ